MFYVILMYDDVSYSDYLKKITKRVPFNEYPFCIKVNDGETSLIPSVFIMFIEVLVFVWNRQNHLNEY